MLSRFLRRLTSRAARGDSRRDRPGTAAAPVASAELAVDPSSAVGRRHATAQDAPAGTRGGHARAAGPRDSDLLAALDAELRSRVAEISASLAPEDRAGDAPRLLDTLTSAAALVVRQPPLAAQRALAVTRDPDVSAATLVKLVEEDPSLSQALLRFANSALYATSAQACVSVHAAVQRIGSAGVHNVVLESMVDGLLCRPGGRYQAMVEQVWSHMVRTAPIARRLAPEFGLVPDNAFALGLLHDIGKLVIFDRIGALRSVLRRELRLSEAFVPRLLRAAHEPLGGIAALQWRLGGLTARAIATHHRAPVPTEPHLASELLYIAERLELASLRGVEPDLAGWWDEGGLLTGRTRVERLLTPA